jgi:teichuronic acid biosynthesis glycosyltransferase TuaC
MKVTFLVTAYPTTGNSVAGIFHKTLAEALVRRGLELEVIAPVPWVPPGLSAFSRRWRQYASTPQLSMTGGIPVRRPRYLHWPRADKWGWPHRGFVHSLKSLSNQADLIHAHFAYPSGLAAATLSRSRQVPFVLTLHGSDVNVQPFSNRFARRRFVEAVNQASAVLAVSESLAEKTRDLAGRRPIVLPIGIDLRRFSQILHKNAARQLLGLPEGRRIVLFVGSLVRSKGLQELLAALMVLQRDQVSGLIIGDGPMSSAVRVSENATYLGPLSPSQVLMYLAAADVLVLTSYAEGMPTVLVEAGAAGLPVVATRVGGVPELLDKERGLLIPPRSVEAIISGLRYVFENREQALQRAARLRSFVHQEYDVSANAGALIEIYKAVVERGFPLKIDSCHKSPAYAVAKATSNKAYGNSIA